MKHYILVKFHDTAPDKERLYPDIAQLFAGAVGMEGVRQVSLFPAVLVSEKRYDLMICIDMEREALAAFDQSSLHRLWKERFASTIAHKVIFDCEEALFSAFGKDPL